MKKQDVKVGAIYIMKHTSGMIRVRIFRETSRRSYGSPTGRSRELTYWEAINLKTGRTIEIKSATRLIREEQVQ